LTKRLLTVGDVELCVEEFGDPADPTILLVGGAAMSMDWWDDDLCTRIAAGGRHVVRFDHRDTGESSTGKPGEPAYGGWQFKLDCIGLVEALGVGPVHLAGLSMGGGVAQVVTLRRPDLVCTLTLISTSAVGGVDAELPGPAPSVTASFEHPIPDPDWADVASYTDWVVAGQRPFTGSHGLDEPRVRSIAADIHARSHDVAAANNHWLVVSGDSDDDEDETTEPLDVRRITAPTLVMHGSDDPMFPLPHGQALAAAIPGATFLVVPGTGHEVPPPETWDLVVPALLDHTAAAG
jgi:pimeloyl-ACP methyl ester carboxylesterase